MKKILTIVLLTFMLFAIALPVLAEPTPAILEEVTVDMAPTAEVVIREEPEPEPMPDPSKGPWTWAYLVTIAGATAATLLIVQFLKVPLDKVWKIPTRLLVYVLCLATLLIANTFFNHGINGETAALCVVNALISAYGAYGMYEVWDKKKPPAA